MNSIADNSEIPFHKLVDALLDVETHFHPRYLYRLSDLEPDELDMLEEIWQRVPLWRRQELMKDLEHLGSLNDLLSFEAVGRHAIRDEDPQVRNFAVGVLREFETRDLVPLFLNLMESDSDVDVRASAASALGRFVYLCEIDKLSDETRVEIENRLLRLIQSNEVSKVRRRALESLGYSGHPEVPGLISTAFSSGKKAWMASALLAMGRSVDERWEEQVTQMLDNKFPSLRVEAARASGELELKDAAPRLLELLDDSDEGVRRASMWSLSQIGGEGVREALEELLVEAEEEEEIRLLETALDNLSFTEGTQSFSLFDFPVDEVEDELLDILEYDEDYPGFDIEADNEELQD
jgi:hypothetical protein